MAQPGWRARLRGPWLVVLFGAAYALQAFLESWGFNRWMNGVGGGGIHSDLLRALLWSLVRAYPLVLFAGTVLTAANLLKRATRWMPSPSRAWDVAQRYLPWTLGALYVAELLAKNAAFWEHWLDGSRGWMVGQLAGEVLATVAAAAVIRAGLRGLAPAAEATQVEANEVPEEGLAAGSETSFAAVAVTSATRGAVGGLAFTAIAMALVAAGLPLHALNDPRFAAAMVAYAAAGLGAASLFRRVSRVTVGIDGVLVRGVGRTRFYGYADLDEVKDSGPDIVLLRRGRVVLCLQLHGEDVARRDALIARFEEAMARAATMRADGTRTLVEATQAHGAAGRRLASAAQGATNYRQPAIAREQLWDLVEGPASEASARTAAAEALLTGMGGDDRARLRVVAESCAEPKVRLALQRLVPDLDGEEDDADVAARPKLPARSLPSPR